MKKVKQLGEITSLISSYMKKGVLTNNFIMQDKYVDYISSGTLYYENTDNALVLLVDSLNHWRVYYHIRELDATVELPKDKPLVMELVYKNDNQALRDQLAFWEERGFKPYISRARMNGNPYTLQILSNAAYPTEYAAEEMANEIHKIISEAFDPYLGCVPDIAEVKEYIRKKEISVIQTPEGSIQGVLHTASKNNMYFIWHLVISPEARGKGLAKGLLACFCNSIKQANSLDQNQNTRIQLWVKKDNKSARGLYEAVGFSYDGWESIGLININN